MSTQWAGYRPRLSPPDFARTRKRFLRYLWERYRYLPFNGIGVNDEVPGSVELTTMYVPAKVLVRGIDGYPAARKDTLREGYSGRIPALDFLKLQSAAVVLGEPGSGKTTLLTYIALRIASGDDVLGTEFGLPVLLPLSAYAKALEARDVRLDDFVGDYYRSRNIDLPVGDLVADAVASGSAVFLLDGLDEAADLRSQSLLSHRVYDFIAANQLTGNKFVLTSRREGYERVRPALDRLAECTIVDFDDTDIRDFVSRWTATVELSDAAAARTRELVVEVFEKDPGVRRLATNPLLLTILALMTREGIRPAIRRVELYENYVQTFLKHRLSARALDRPLDRSLAVGDTVKVLSALALWMHRSQQGNSSSTFVDLSKIESELVRIYRARHDSNPREAAIRLIEVAVDHVGLLTKRAGQARFLHTTLQEYLAAVAIVDQSQQDIRPIVGTIANYLKSPAWREVIRLVIGYLGVVQHRDAAAGTVIERMIRALPRDAGLAVAVAGEATADAAPDGVAAKSVKILVRSLQTTVRNHSAVDPVVRAAAGAALGRLGDPRFRRDAWFLPRDQLLGFVKIPAGRFTMGSDAKTDPLAYEDELPQHVVKLPAYYIARWPVTVAQFRAFVEAADNDDFKPEDPHCLLGAPNQPVVWISWHEALAYCRWLTRSLRDWPQAPLPLRRRMNSLTESRWSITLPSEAEWEKAARGAGRRICPWGAKPDSLRDSNRANYGATGIGATSAVGCFPGSASPYGVEELSGNVWEWTRSLWGDPMFQYPYVPGPRHENLGAPDNVCRAVRGGAFFDSAGVVRSALRYGLEPTVRGKGFGFRLALTPFRPEAGKG